MQTLYANIVNLKVTPNEVVLEFGNSFPDQPGQNPLQVQPDIRIVLAPSVLQGLAQGFTQAAAQQPGNATAPPVGPVGPVH